VGNGETVRLTPKIAGSFGTGGGAGLVSLGVSSILRSFTSLPRNMMYSKGVAEGEIASSPLRRSSVPKDLTSSSATVEFSELISTSVPT